MPILHTIPTSLWNAIIGFHRNVALIKASECVTYHKWSKKSLKYITIIPWQTCKPHPFEFIEKCHDLDLSPARKANVELLYDGHEDVFAIPKRESCDFPHNVDLSWEDPRNQILLSEYRRIFNEDFLPACTVYSRVNHEGSLSYISSIGDDLKEGWHITLGKLFSKQYDIKAWTACFITRKSPVLNYVPEPSSLNINDLLSDEIEGSFFHTTPGTHWWQPHVGRVNSKLQSAKSPLSIPITPYPIEEIAVLPFSVLLEPLDWLLVEDPQKQVHSLVGTWENCRSVDKLFSILNTHAPITKEQSVQIAVHFAEHVAPHEQHSAICKWVIALPEQATVSTQFHKDNECPELPNNPPLRFAKDWLKNPTAADSKVSSIAWEKARQANRVAGAASENARLMNVVAESVKTAREAAKAAAGSPDVAHLHKAKTTAQDALLATNNAAHIDPFYQDADRWRTFWSTCDSIWEIVISTSKTDDARVSSTSVAFAALSSELYSALEAATYAYELTFKRASSSWTSASAFWAQASAASWSGDRDAACAAKSAVCAALQSSLYLKYPCRNLPDSAYYECSNEIIDEVKFWTRTEEETNACIMIRDIVSNPFI